MLAMVVPMYYIDIHQCTLYLSTTLTWCLDFTVIMCNEVGIIMFSVVREFIILYCCHHLIQVYGLLLS